MIFWFSQAPRTSSERPFSSRFRAIFLQKKKKKKPWDLFSFSLVVFSRFHAHTRSGLLASVTLRVVLVGIFFGY
jgi:hypothetical protein